MKGEWGQAVFLGPSPAELLQEGAGALVPVATKNRTVKNSAHPCGLKIRGLNCAVNILACSPECAYATSCFIIRYCYRARDILLPSLRAVETWLGERKWCQGWGPSLFHSTCYLFYPCIKGTYVLVFSHIILKICGLRECWRNGCFSNLFYKCSNPSTSYNSWMSAHMEIKHIYIISDDHTNEIPAFCVVSC